MQIAKWEFIPQCWITLTSAEIEILTQASVWHYDTTCRRMSKDGILAAFKNFPDTDHPLKHHDLDILTKIAENRLPGKEEETRVLHNKLYSLLKDFNVQFTRVNA